MAPRKHADLVVNSWFGEPHDREIRRNRRKPHPPGRGAGAPARPADASLYFIGRIRTPWTARKDCPKNARVSRESGVVCTIEVDPRWAQALPGVETCSHLIVLYWMDRARRDLVVQMPTRAEAGRPTFSVRSPVRPNPIALSVVELRKVEGNPPRSGRARLPGRHAACSTSSPISPPPTPSPTPASVWHRPDPAAARVDQPAHPKNRAKTTIHSRFEPNPRRSPDQWSEPRGSP